MHIYIYMPTSRYLYILCVCVCVLQTRSLHQYLHTFMHSTTLYCSNHMISEKEIGNSPAVADISFQNGLFVTVTISA